MDILWHCDNHTSIFQSRLFTFINKCLLTYLKQLYAHSSQICMRCWRLFAMGYKTIIKNSSRRSGFLHCPIAQHPIILHNSTMTLIAYIKIYTLCMISNNLALHHYQGPSFPSWQRQLCQICLIQFSLNFKSMVLRVLYEAVVSSHAWCSSWEK